MNANVRDAVTFLKNPPVFSLFPTGTTSIPNSALTAVAWGSATVDNYGGWSVSPNPTRWTAPVAGWYYCAGVVQLAFNATGRRATALYVNGAIVRQTEMQVISAASTAHQISGYVFLNKNDYVEFRIFQNSGGALNAGGAGTGGGIYGRWIHS
jgi:hypothetical protein